MDRAPKKPPFPVGTKLRYRGTREAYWGWGKDGGICPIVAPGIEVMIDEARIGYRGTLRQIRDEVYDDTGEPILDTTRDGYSVYHVTDPSGHVHGRCIDPGDVGEWELVE